MERHRRAAVMASGDAPAVQLLLSESAALFLSCGGAQLSSGSRLPHEHFLTLQKPLQGARAEIFLCADHR